MSEKHKNHKLKYEKYTAELVSFLRSIEKKDAIDLISDLLTPQEIIEIQERIQLLKKLKKGETQREIAKDL
jgi:Trp operon repressor